MSKFILFKIKLNIFFFTLESSTTVSNRETGEETEVIVAPQESKANKPITFFRAWLLPGVAMVRERL